MIRLTVVVMLLIAGCGTVRVHGLRPVFPVTHWWDGLHRADSLRPTLEWAPLGVAPGRRVIGYDIRVWRSISSGSALRPDRLLVYQREALPESRHTLGVTLDPGTDYLWTVRARVEVDGATRVTDWARYADRVPVVDGSVGPWLPEPAYFVFRTPGLTPRGNPRNTPRS